MQGVAVAAAATAVVVCLLQHVVVISDSLPNDEISLLHVLSNYGENMEIQDAETWTV